MKKCMPLGLIAALILAWSASSLQAATVTSANFSLAYGVTGDNLDLSPTVWTDVENASTNTATTIGDFTFAPALTGGAWDRAGVTFVDRVLANGTTAPAAGFIGWFGTGGDRPFSVPIAASYNGSAPGNASETPDFKLAIEITKISIYGARYDANTLETLAWDETTIGHEQTSPSVNLTIATVPADEVNAANYTQLVWNPDDYDVPLGSLNETFTRTFDILPGDGNDFRFGDGLEIEGRVHLIYNAVGGVPGDFDNDSDVDGADFVVWQTNFPTASGATLATGDADGDSDVDGADFVVWQTNFPTTPVPGASPVPEPKSLILAALGGLIVLSRRRRWLMEA